MSEAAADGGAAKPASRLSKLRPKASRKTIVDTALALFGLGGPTLLQLLYVIAAARALSADEFGQLMLCVAVATVASFVAGVGSDGVALKAIARDGDAVQTQFGQALTMVVVSAAPVIMLAVLVTLWLSQVATPLWLPIAIAIAEVLFGRIAMTSQKMFIALSQQLRAAISGMFVPLARLASSLVILFIAPTNALEDFATAYFASTMIAVVVCYVYTTRLVGKPLFGFRGVRLGEGASFALAWVNTSLQVECDKMILAYFATPASVGVYSLASRLMDGAFNPPRALRISLQARMMREGSKGHSAMYRFMLRVLPISIAYGFLAWGAIALTAPLFVYVFGPSYAELARILPLMGALPLLRSIADIGSELFIGSDRVTLSTVVQVVATVMRVVVGVALISVWAIDGAVWSALATTTILAVMFWVLAFLLDRRAGQKAVEPSSPNEP